MAFERGGPERFLPSFQLVAELFRALGADPPDVGAIAIGWLSAHIMTRRRPS
ncbi:hypothetical protein [Rhodopila sp.]|uniref:hypothetical protein n=1 Tax=Rhodopila sp. TaxID=2480087 RepID=UPI003D11D64E